MSQDEQRRRDTTAARHVIENKAHNEQTLM